MSRENRFQQLTSAPPPLFLGKKERDFVAHITLETQEKIIGQSILYYPIDLERTRYHSIYGEAINKSFLPPIQVYVAIEWEGYETKTEKISVDRAASIKVHFFKRRLVEEKDLNVQVGDFVQYGEQFFEIVKLDEPRELFGQAFAEKVEIEATCIKARKGVFNVA